MAGDIKTLQFATGVSSTTSTGSVFQSKTANYTALVTDRVIAVDASSNDVTITLPAASGNTGVQYVIKRTDDASANAFDVTIDGNSSETIDGRTTRKLCTQYGYISIICDGSTWHVMEYKDTIILHARVGTLHLPTFANYDPIEFDTATIDKCKGFNTGTYGFTSPEARRYNLTVFIQTTSLSNGLSIQVFPAIDAAEQTDIGHYSFHNTTGSTQYLDPYFRFRWSAIVTLADGEVFDLRSHGSGAYAIDDDYTFFQLESIDEIY